ncbi:carbohydrate kinase family protein [Ponticoccus alexandrii]|uniref:Carbohydrate kinase PfkB domain-containing protein n=1 Tax=Ponticoccus alexandrii TaxID=1943633 RepID=A0ABX7F9U5_9RHOB|nr:carbohydrate kinase family protein [Ponticoccus alexandrii]ETA51703.1 hypothetical protein P279_12650 [Rhodobacteraceae bacterium PD-2]QRF66577.1 hypothetical protein GQA70_09825 [Ponticoccus alexandrii]
MSRLLVFGDASFDQTFFAPHIPAPDEKVHCSGFAEGYGGVALNTAIAAARAGGEVTLVAQVGTDAPSAALADYLSEAGVSHRLNATDGVIARVTTLVATDGEKRLLLYPGVSLYPDPACAEELSLDGVAHVHTAIYGPAGTRLIERARSAGASWSLDLEPATFAAGLEALQPQIEGAALIFVNDRAAAQIGADAVDVLFEMGAAAVLRTRGPAGATLYRPDGSESANASCPKDMPIVDTTGAGDCLAGWYLARHLAGAPPQEALRLAVTAATRACGFPGTHAGYPSLHEIEQ